MQALLILGMHRSYTSLVSRWLGACGLNLGDKLLPKGVGNQDGHFEDTAILDLHRKALRQAGLQGNGMVEIGQPAFDQSRYAALSFEGDLHAEACRLLERKIDAGMPFAWKEPRTCLFLPFYRKQLDCRSLVLFRGHQEVVGSLLAREGPALRDFYYRGIKRPLYWLNKSSIDQQVGALKDGFLDAWIHYNSCLLDHIEREGVDRTIVHDLQSLAPRSSSVIAKLNAWGVNVVDRSLNDFVRPLSNYDTLDFDTGRRERADEITARFRDLIERG